MQWLSKLPIWRISASFALRRGQEQYFAFTSARVSYSTEWLMRLMKWLENGFYSSSLFRCSQDEPAYGLRGTGS
jgi:hypothetical protein